MSFASGKNQLIDLDAPGLARRLGRVVSTLELAIAKNMALGISVEAISEILGGQYSPDEIRELADGVEFKELFQIITQHLLEINSDTSISWDQIENMALKNLVAEIQINKDPDLNLRVAAVANKAQRRHTNKSNVLDPGLAVGERVTISLTQRFIRKLSGADEVEERKISLHGIRNPSNDEISALFSPEAKAQGDALRAIESVMLVQEPAPPQKVADHRIVTQRSNSSALDSRLPPPDKPASEWTLGERRAGGFTEQFGKLMAARGTA